MMSRSKELLFSVGASDCEWSYTRGTGKGGQKKNKTSSAVHCMHRPSGAHGYSEASRSQLENKQEAFRKMAESKEFKAWWKIEVARKTGQLYEIEQEVERQMRNVRVEGKDEDGKWVELKDESF
jgi:protein subunit release factor B